MVKENIGYRKIVTEKQKTAFVLEISLDGEHWTVVRDNRQDNADYPHDLILFPDLTACRYLRLRDMEVPMGGVPAVSGLRVFGKGKGQKPAKVCNVQACPRGEIDIGLSWDLAEGADGYNVRYGIAPDKLYLSWQLYGQTELNLSMINKGQPYYAAVDSYNENGVTLGDVVQIRGSARRQDMKQVLNPFLPLREYIADGEPHVFGDRVYLVGSHDREGGESFCMLDYVIWSAPVDDLTNWSNSGVNYSAKQDPLYVEGKCCHLYAPDVVRGNDGKYYLYYCLSGFKGDGGYKNPISVAVADAPDGKYAYLGVVRDRSGAPYMRYVCFDPAVLNDNGVIRLYYGTCYPFDEYANRLTRNAMAQIQAPMFGRTAQEIMSCPGGIMGAVTVTLADDMLTVSEEAKRIIPTQTRNTSFAGHAFYEGSSIRKVGDRYYFIYSSLQNHELCYAVSKYPDRDFRYGGTIVSNGDVGLHGRKPKDRLNQTGTNHGSIEKIGDQWYVFYHRLTHGSGYSRQACAEKIWIERDGSIRQVPVSSCGLNRGPLLPKGTYPAS